MWSGELRLRAAIAVAVAAAALGCRQKMADSPRFDPLEPSELFPDGRSARPLPRGVVPRGFLDADERLFQGTENGRPVARIPLPVTPELLLRGRERHDIFCAPCHGLAGDGNGMIAQRGFRPFSSYHTDRLRAAPDGTLYAAIANGVGRQLDFRHQIPPADRWAIVAWVRVLQLSQHAPEALLRPQERRRLDEEAP